VRVFGIPIYGPRTVVNRVVTDVTDAARLARVAPAQLERLLELGEEIAAIGRQILVIAERLDERADAIMALGERLDRRAEEVLELGTTVAATGVQINERGAEIVETGAELIAVMPTFERALDMATPLEGAIDRFGRLVDRLPGGGTRRQSELPSRPPARDDEPLERP
jgi:hypothetical protein